MQISQKATYLISNEDKGYKVPSHGSCLGATFNISQHIFL